MNAPQQLQSERHFDDAWLERLEWQGLDRNGELSRWRAHDPQSNRHWLIVRASVRASPWELARLDREYALGPCLDADWAVLPLAHMNTLDGAVLLLDDEHGRPLSSIANLPLSVERFLQLAIASSAALDKAHRRGLLHRDIRPANLILDDHGVVRLSGFASAILSTDDTENVPALPDCSLAYHPPEQTPSAQSDLYALGVSFFELLTGHLPFSATDPVQWLHQHVAVAAPALNKYRPGLPAALNDLLSRLLAKEQTLRIESAQLLEVELRRCLDEWHEVGSIHRTSQPFARTQRTLVGRESELATLRDALGRLEQGLGGVVLISGEAGIGKTSLVRQLHRDQGRSQILLANGKCELARHSSPYATLSAALASLFTRLAGEQLDDVRQWGEQLRAALGHGANILARMVPELEWLTGTLSPTTNPPAVSEARRHLHGALHNLMGVLATRAYPLILFLDDVQWIDEESLSFIKELTPSNFDHLLLIAAYRNNKAFPDSHLSALINHCRTLGARTVELAPRPLTDNEVATILGTELTLHPAERELLAERISQRSNGNPLYVTQFVAMLGEAEDSGHSAECPPLLEDIAALLGSRMARLPEHTQEALCALAILGNQTPLETLAAVTGTSVSKLLNRMRPAFQAGLIGQCHAGLSFTHDAVWESARARTPALLRNTLHVNSAQSLLNRLDTDAEPEAVFRVAAQILRADVTRLDEQQQLSFTYLLIRAAHLAMAAAAAATALDYLNHARYLFSSLVTTDSALGRDLALLYVQGLILNADYGAADRHVGEWLQQTKAPLPRAELYRLKCEIYSLHGDYAGVVDTAISGLAELGVALPHTSAPEQADQAWLALQEELGGRSPDIFSSLPDITDARIQAVIELLAAVVIPGSFIRPDLMLLCTCRIASLTLQYGMSTLAVQALGWLGVACAHRFDLYQLGFTYSTTARQLTEQPRYAGSRMAVLIALDQVSVWSKPLPFALECAEQAYRASLAQNSPSFACYANNHIVSDLLVLGAPIERMLRQIDVGLVMARNLEFTDAQSILHAQALYIRRLAGDNAGSISIPSHTELSKRIACSSMGPLRFWWELYEGLLSFLEGSFEQANQHLDQAWSLAWSAPAHIHLIDLAMFTVLTRAALQTSKGTRQCFAQPMQRLRLWAKLNPRYFADRLALAEAELLRIEGRDLEALQQYEEAISKAEQCGAIHIKGLAHEMAYRMHQTLGLHSSARTHIRHARDAWRRWGASALAEQLEAEHAFLREPTGLAPEGHSLPASHQLDMLSITRACQALSREIEPDSLIKTLLANAALYAGATYSTLLLCGDIGLRVEASGLADGRGIEVQLRPPASAVEAAPLSLISQVINQREALILTGSEAFRRFGEDPYLGRIESGSLMCVPLLKQNEVVGVLYLENNLTQSAFEPARLDVLELLTAQAAISLSNARLYSELLDENQLRRESESTLRRTQALLAMGQAVSRYSTFIWRQQTEHSFWSERLLEELGLPMPSDTEHLHNPGVLVHADDRSRFNQGLTDALKQLRPFRLEFRTVAFDGAPRHLELSGEPDGNEAFIGVVCDISERRQAEVTLRTARSKLDRTSQATIIDELAASIAHEINQPLASILSNAGASLRWLERPQPAIDDALEGIRDILSESQRAADIVRSMRTLAQQKPAARTPLTLERVIHQVLAITQADLDDKHVSVTLKICATAQVLGDSIQLQQVLRNLITNAVDAMQSLPPRSRHLSICALPLAEEVLLLVEDSGPGVPTDKLNQVFQAFFSTKANGMGMGLAICASIIAAHGGVLGTTRGRHDESVFFLTLPAQHV